MAKISKNTASRALTVPTIEESAIVFNRIRPLAEAIDERDLVEFATDPQLVYHNVRAGVDAVLTGEARIRAELVTVRVEDIRETMLIAQALLFAAAEVRRIARPLGTTAELVSRAYELRGTLIDNARPLVRAGLLPANVFREILKGSGKIDAANDCVDLAQMFRDAWTAVENKTVVTPEMLTEAAQLGSRLQTILLPGRAARRERLPEAMVAAIAIRDRIWTLLRRRHDLIWRVGAWLWGREVDERVPALQSAQTRRRQEPEDAPPVEDEEGDRVAFKGSETGGKAALQPAAMGAVEPETDGEEGVDVAETGAAGGQGQRDATATGSPPRGSKGNRRTAKGGAAAPSPAKQRATERGTAKKKGPAGQGGSAKGMAKRRPKTK